MPECARSACEEDESKKECRGRESVEGCEEATHSLAEEVHIGGWRCGVWGGRVEVCVRSWQVLVARRGSLADVVSHNRKNMHIVFIHLRKQLFAASEKNSAGVLTASDDRVLS